MHTIPGRIDQRELRKTKAIKQQQKLYRKKKTQKKLRCRCAWEEEGTSYAGEKPATGLFSEQVLGIQSCYHHTSFVFAQSPSF